MKKVMSRWVSPLFVIMAVVLLISGCGNSSNAASSGNGSEQETKTLRISFNPGPYSDQFKNGVAPSLRKKGTRLHTRSSRTAFNRMWP
ncbi:D-methionine transport system substrate-binding protein [Paenibacillus sophorae]|uniref:D-methionine transport system substrate-binding protein n=1 Tax=Paenibacillus sophorae TaxID=1333845 RepID=A0A1H8L2T7_9BACL|nr:hypothetical protein [Paenibacillus sophorae]SEN99437.1 D-methionine transport system substrate-binding protein [Paenibacillus sophorae]